MCVLMCWEPMWDCCSGAMKAVESVVLWAGLRADEMADGRVAWWDDVRADQ